MNASDLHSIVAGVDRAAWPRGVEATLTVNGWTFDRGGTARKIDEMTEAFTASMMLWLIGQGFHSFEWAPEENEITLDLYDRHFAVSRETKHAELHLLAAACKAVMP